MKLNGEPKHVLRNSDDSNYFTEISRIFVITNLSVFYTFIARIKFLQSVDSTCESLSSVFLVNKKKTICKEDRRCERRYLSQCQKNSGFRFATVSCVIAMIFFTFIYSLFQKETDRKRYNSLFLLPFTLMNLNNRRQTDIYLISRAGLFKAGLPMVSANFEFRCESLKSQFNLILFFYNSVIGCSEKNRGCHPRKGL